MQEIREEMGHRLYALRHTTKNYPDNRGEDWSMLRQITRDKYMAWADEMIEIMKANATKMGFYHV